MAEITVQMIKTLRDRTGVGMAKCKDALSEANGDMELAIANLRKAGIAGAVKKEGRETNEGIIKVASSNKGVALVEINAETDFVVKNERFQEFAQRVAEDALKLMPSSLEEFVRSPCSHDAHLTLDEYRSTIIQTLGENIQIRRFELFPKKKNSSVGFYSHAGGKLLTLVVIEGSENEEILAKEIAMHIAAEAPEYLTSDEVPERVKEHEREIARAQVQGKPQNVMDKIVEGKLQAYYDQVCLLHQKYVKDPSVKISALVEKKGKQLKITQFLRWNVGG